MRGLFKQTNPEKPLGGRYKIVSELGAGGFGQTFLAQDLHLPDHPHCVVKQLKPQRSDTDTLQMARRLFDMEARVLYLVGNHDQIPRLLAHFEDNQEFYLAQELIEGEPLSQELQGGQRWSETQVLSVLQDLLYVLAFVHQQNVIHRDIKPSNLIRRRRDSKIVLIDFGAVKQVSAQYVDRTTGLTTKTISIGTQGYTPKEQLGGNPRFSSDLYAVGMLAIQALTGIHPRHLTEDPQTGEINWRHHAVHISPELAGFLDRMVRYDFRARYSTAADALAALRNLSPAIAHSAPLPQSLSEEELGDLPTQGLPPSPAVTESTDSEFAQASTQQRPPTNAAVQPPPTTATDSEFAQASTQQWTPTNAAVQPPPITATDSEFAQASTQQWVPPNPPVSPQPPVTSTGATEHLGQLQPSGPSSVTSAPTNSSPKRKPIVLGSSLALLAAVGSTFLLSKTVLPPQLASQTVNRTEVPTASPSTSPSETSASPSSSSSSTASLTTSPSETSTSPSPTSSSTASPTTSPSETAASPSPISSPTAPQASPTPVTPVAQSTPAPVPSPAKPSPSPSGPQVGELLSQADRSREAGQYQKAVELYDKAIALKPDAAQAHWGRCYSLNSVQQYDDAIAACNQALGINPNYAEALWSKGAALQKQQRHMEALKQYERATALKPDFAEAWNNQGVALLALQRPSEAVTAFEKATNLKPNLADAWANRGAALWALKRYDGAIASMDKALQIQPDNPDAINLRQLAREKLGR